MYVCHCRGVTDHTIEGEVERGATTIEQIADRCGAGADCGGCWPELEKLLERHFAPGLARELVCAPR